VPPLRVAVVGCGAFGRNHLRVYREIERSHPDLLHLAALVEPDPTRRNELAAAYSIPSFCSVTELLSASSPALSLSKGPSSGTSVDAASICVPTLHHAAVAEQLLLAGPANHGIDILIEKPFAATLAEADHLTALAQKHHRILAVGHLERFNPAVTSTAQAITSPMFFEAHRLSIFTPRSLDVDVVLDLMIHDLDIVLSLSQSPVKEVRAVGLPILSCKTDIANARIEFDSGCVANFTASRVSTEQVRKLRLFQPHQYLSLDFARQELLSISVDPSILAAISASTDAPQTLSSRPESALFANVAERPATPSTPPPTHGGLNPKPPPAEAPIPHDAAPFHPTPGFTLAKPDILRAEPLRLELEDFLHAVRNRTQPRVPAQAGRAALALALEINAHIADHAHRAGLKSEGVRSK
jgi:predicted dehydrogenase